MTAKRRPAPPPWLPDWRTVNSYPRDTAPVEQFRWEFLRRRPDYAADYEALTGPRQRVTFRNAGQGRLRVEGKKAPPDFVEKYGLAIMLDPAASEVPHRYFALPPSFNVGADAETMTTWDLQGYTLCRIDLAQPIGEQLSRLLPALKAEAKIRGLAPAGKRQKSQWRFYLRVLDAYAVPAAWSSILHTLHRDWVNPNDSADVKDSTDLTQGKTTVSRWHRQARHQMKVMTRP